MCIKNGFFIVLLLLFVTSCGQFNSVEYNDASSYSGVVYWYKQDFPITIHIPDSMMEFQQQFINAGEKWNKALGITVFNFVFDHTPNLEPKNLYDSLGDKLNGIYQEPNFNYPSQGLYTLATTVTSMRKERILEADILFNYKQFAFDDYDTHPFSSNYIDFESVLVHELGHVLGLSHINTDIDPFSIMNPSISKASKKRELSNDDLGRIQNLYKIQ